jgi:hypothetical protein
MKLFSVEKWVCEDLKPSLKEAEVEQNQVLQLKPLLDVTRQLFTKPAH